MDNLVEANNSESTVHKKRKPSTTAVIAVICSFVALILSVVEVIACYFSLNSGGLNEAAGTIWIYLMFIVGFIVLISAVFILASFIVSLFQKPRLLNFLTTILAILLLVSAVIVELVVNRTKIEPARYVAYSMMWHENLDWFVQAFRKYSQEHEGQLPPGDNWCDALIKLYPEEPNHYGFSRLERYNRFAFNENLSEMSLPDIPQDVVLLFEAKIDYDNRETKKGRNPFGGKNLITAENHYGKGCVILFGDLHYTFVKAEDFNNLHWQP